MVVTIYKLDASPAARTVLMTVDSIGLKVNYVDVGILQEDHLKPEYTKKNPLHTVPLLEEDDFILADSHAIITYLVSKYGADKRSVLYPVDLRQRATIDQRLYFDATVAFPPLLKIVNNARKLNQGPSQEDIDKVNEVYGYVETYLDSRPYLAGEHITLADIAAVATLSSLDVFVPIGDKYVKVREWWNKLRAKEWYQSANQPGLEKFSQYKLLYKHN